MKLAAFIPSSGSPITILVLMAGPGTRNSYHSRDELDGPYLLPFLWLWLVALSISALFLVHQIIHFDYSGTAFPEALVLHIASSPDAMDA